MDPSTKADLPYVAKNIAFRSDGKPVWEPYTYNHAHDFWNLDPKLIDPARGNYHLKPDSPAIGAGVELPEVKVDLDDLPRPVGKPRSIGAFEYRAQQQKSSPSASQADQNPASTR